MSSSYHESMKAAGEDDVSTLRSLLDFGVSPNLIHPKRGHSILQIASECNSLGTLELLLLKGADPDLKFTIISVVDFRTICKDATALMYARSVESAELLLKYGASLKIRDAYGNSAVDWAKKNENVELYKYLCSAENS